MSKQELSKVIEENESGATTRTYYEILGFPKDALKKEISAEEIREAYKNRALAYHPDRNPGNDEAALEFKNAEEAYKVLSDSQKRARYDALPETMQSLFPVLTESQREKMYELQEKKNNANVVVGSVVPEAVGGVAESVKPLVNKKLRRKYGLGHAKLKEMPASVEVQDVVEEEDGDQKPEEVDRKEYFTLPDDVLNYLKVVNSDISQYSRIEVKIHTLKQAFNALSGKKLQYGIKDWEDRMLSKIDELLYSFKEKEGGVAPEPEAPKEENQGSAEEQGLEEARERLADLIRGKAAGPEDLESKEIALKLLQELNEKIRKSAEENSELLKNEEVQDLMRQAEPPYGKVIGRDLEKDAKLYATESILSKPEEKRAHFTKESDLRQITERLFAMTKNPAEKKEMAKQEKNMLKHIDKKWKELTKEKQEEYRKKYLDEGIKRNEAGRLAMLDFTVELAKNRFTEIKLNSKKKIVDLASSGNEIYMDVVEEDLAEMLAQGKGFEVTEDETEDESRQVKFHWRIEWTGRGKYKLTRPENINEQELARVKEIINTAIINQRAYIEAADENYIALYREGDIKNLPSGLREGVVNLLDKEAEVSRSEKLERDRLILEKKKKKPKPVKRPIIMEEVPAKKVEERNEDWVRLDDGDEVDEGSEPREDAERLEELSEELEPYYHLYESLDEVSTEAEKLDASDAKKEAEKQKRKEKQEQKESFLGTTRKEIKDFKDDVLSPSAWARDMKQGVKDAKDSVGEAKEGIKGVALSAWSWVKGLFGGGKNEKLAKESLVEGEPKVEGSGKEKDLEKK